MAIGLNISQQVLVRVDSTLKLAIDIQKELEGQPTQDKLVKDIVDVELVDGMKNGLLQLVDKIDATALDEFKQRIQEIGERVQAIRSTLQERTKLINSPKDLQVEDQDAEPNLFTRAKNLFEQLHKLNEGALDKPDEIETITKLAQTEISEIRSKTKNQNTIQELSRADAELQQINEMKHLLMATEIKPVQPLPHTQGAFVFANTNQYSDEFDKLYTGGRLFKQSACTAIAGHFVLATLQGKRAETLNEIMNDGQTTNARIMRQRPPKDGEHLEFTQIVRENEFSGLKEMDIPHDLTDANPFLLNINILNASRDFEDALKLLNELKKRSQIDEIGAVFTARGESYGLVMMKTGVIAFFDSHGNKDLTKSELAYATAFNDIKGAAEFLAKRMPIVRGFEEDHYNTCVFTPVCLKKQDSHSPTLQVNPVNIPPKTNHALQASVVEFYQNIIQALKKKNDEGFLEASSHITQLSFQKCLFAMTDKESGSISERIFFHVYQLHRAESPQKLDGSANYGSKTFQNGHASPEERLRTAQRTFIELAFAGIEDAINTKNISALRECLGFLEEMNLQQNDLPKNQNNIAHYLFGKLYHHYKAAAESNKTLTHPDDKAFNGEFGRNAFCDKADITIDPQFKLDVIKQVRNELKQTWRI